MYFEYPYLLWLLVLPALLVLRYLWIEWKDRRVHMRVSALDAWKAGGRSVLEIVRHLPAGVYADVIRQMGIERVRHALAGDRGVGTEINAEHLRVHAGVRPAAAVDLYLPA